MYRVVVTPVVGLPQFAGWSQVVTNQVSAQVADHKELVCALAVAGEHAGNSGRQLAAQIKAASVKTAAQLHQFLTDLQAEAEELGVELLLAVGLFSAQKMTLAVSGGQILLKRDDKIGLLLESEDKLKFIEGRHESSDVLVLLTQQAEDFVSEIKLKFESGFGLDSVVTSIVPGLHGLQDSSLSSLAFVSGGKTVELSSAELSSAELSLAAPVKEKAKPASVSFDPPPALKLRGAGQKNQPKVEAGTLTELGQVQKKSRKKKNNFKWLQKGLKKSWRWLRSRDWRGWWVKLVCFLSQVAVGFRKLGRRLVTWWQRLVAGGVYLKSRSPRQKLKIILPVAVVVLLLLGGSGFRFYQLQQQCQLAAAALAPHQVTLEQARTQLEAEPVIAREKVKAVIVELERLQVEFAEQKKAQQIVTDQLKQAQALAEQISGQEQLDQLQIFFDLQQVSQDFVTTTIDGVANGIADGVADGAANGVAQKIAFLDQGQNLVLVLDLVNKQTQSLSSVEARDLELSAENIFLLHEGIKQLAVTTSATTSATTSGSIQIIPEGDSNRAATLLEAFGSYIYVLNPDKRDIYRYVERKEGCSDPIGWVSGAAGFAYDEVSSWAIDGDIWVATRTGGLHRLAAGREQDFTVVGLEIPFQSTLYVYTDENLENLYLLEPDQQRLVVLNKEGQFLQEIQSASLAATSGLFVSEEIDQAFVVSGSIVYSVEL